MPTKNFFAVRQSFLIITSCLRAIAFGNFCIIYCRILWRVHTRVDFAGWFRPALVRYRWVDFLSCEWVWSIDPAKLRWKWKKARQNWLTRSWVEKKNRSGLISYFWITLLTWIQPRVFTTIRLSPGRNQLTFQTTHSLWKRPKHRSQLWVDISRADIDLDDFIPKLWTHFVRFLQGRKKRVDPSLK